MPACAPKKKCARSLKEHEHNNWNGWERGQKNNPFTSNFSSTQLIPHFFSPRVQVDFVPRKHLYLRGVNMYTNIKRSRSFAFSRAEESCFKLIPISFIYCWWRPSFPAIIVSFELLLSLFLNAHTRRMGIIFNFETIMLFHLRTTRREVVFSYYRDIGWLLLDKRLRFKSWLAC